MLPNRAGAPSTPRGMSTMNSRSGARGAGRGTCGSTSMSMLLSVAASLLGAACGGGRGGSTGGGGGGGGGGPTVTGGGFAPSSGPGDTQNYVPASVGNAWKLSYAAPDTNNVTTAGLLALSIPGTKTVLGATATVFDQQDGVGGIGFGQDFYV